MAGERGRTVPGFRPDPVAAAPRPSHAQSLALALVLVLVAGAVAAVSYLVRPERARAFSLFSGSLFLADSVAPVAVDLATGSPSVRLIDATAQVGTTPQRSLDLAVTPLDPGGGTLLLDSRTGEFNMVDATGFVIKRDGGVPVARQPKSWAVGLPAHTPGVPDLAYVEQSGAARTSVYLVSQQTVRNAVTARHVPPRASRTLTLPASSAPGAQASAHGSFWLLTGTGARHGVVQLSLPRSSRADGATLTERAHGSVTGPAALESATVTANPASPAAVAVASPDRLTVFTPGGGTRTTAFTAPAGVDRILPVSAAAGRLSFLLHGSSGWSLLSAALNGTGVRGPTPVTALGAASTLVAPAQSGDALWTMDTGSGELIRIDGDAAATPVPGAATYPLATDAGGTNIEPGGFSDAYVVARGPRVFFDSPSHRNALAVFTDESRRPAVIQKSDAVGLNAAGDAAALSRNHEKLAGTRTGGRKQPSTQPLDKHKTVSQSVNTAIDCRTTTQKPNIPQVYGVQPASRSVTFSWLYPRSGNEDCEPRTYVVTATLLTANAPPAPGSVTVQDQDSVTLNGLYPNSSYQITVTAYLGALSTTSRPAFVHTSPQGPDAPSGVAVHADPSGNWVLSWDSCGTASDTCVPSSSWDVEAQVCDGRGLVPSLPSLVVPADPTTRRQPTAVYHGGTALLGRGLSFQVMGRGVDNLPGTFSASTPCAYSWSPPVASAMRLTASQPGFASFGDTASTTVSLDLGNAPVRDVGGVGASVTLQLSGNGSTQTRGPFVVDGSAATVSADFANVAAGADYTASATVQPAHGGTPVVLSADRITGRSDWPTFDIQPSCSLTLLACNLRVSFTGISSALARGEQFSLTPQSGIQCNNNGEQFTGSPADPSPFDPATGVISTSLSQLNGYYGTCTVTAQLVESPSDPQPLFFGGITSPAVKEQVTLGAPTHADLQSGDFAVAWSQQNGSSTQIEYTGSQNLSDVTTAGGWTEKLTDITGQSCGSASDQPGGGAGSAAYITIPQACIQSSGGLPLTWTVTIGWTNRVDGTTGSVTKTLVGPPLGYTPPCTVSGLAAAYGATLADGIGVSVDQANSTLSSCSDWTYTIFDTSTSPATQVCAVSSGIVTGAPPQTIDLSTCGTPPTDTWEVQVGWQDEKGNPQQSDMLPVTGTPPTS